MLKISYEDVLLNARLPEQSTRFIDASQIKEWRGSFIHNCILLNMTSEQDFSGAVLYNAFPKLSSCLNIAPRFDFAENIKDIKVSELFNNNIYLLFDTIDRLLDSGRWSPDTVVDLSNLNLSSGFFSIEYNRIRDCIFSASNISLSNILQTNIYNSDFAEAKAVSCVFYKCMFGGDYVSFENANLSKSKFINGYIIADINFTGADVTDAVFTHEFEDFLSDEQKLSAIMLSRNTELSNKTICDFEFYEIILKGASLNFCVFANLKAGREQFGNRPVNNFLNLHFASAEDCEFRRISCDRVDFNYASFTRCTFSNIVINNAELRSAQFYHCSFENCRFIQDAEEADGGFSAEFFSCEFVNSKIPGSETNIVS